MEQQADTSKYDDLILSTMDICTLLRDEGKIDAATYQRASSFLHSQGQSPHANPPPSVFNGSICIDRLALSYLQSAKLLQPMAAVGLNIRIHPDVLREMNALTKVGDVGDDLVTKIERIRDVLRNAVASGTASYLPRTVSKDEGVQNHDIRFQATASLLAGSHPCDALCIDDRYINSHPVWTEPTKRSVPIVCVLDVLRYLVSRGCISVADHWTVRHRLRQSGLAFIRLDSDELVHWLTAARVNNGQLTESAELRILRQTMARIDSLDLANSNEMLALSADVHRTCKQTIANLWADSSLTIEQAATLSNWVWRNLIAAAIWAHEHTEQGGYKDWIQELISVRLGHLLLPTVIRPLDRRAHYTHWIERSVLEPLRPANADMIDKALTVACEAISALEKDRAYGHLFLDNLPETLRSLVLNRDPEFGRHFGFETQRIFSIGTNLKLADSELFAAAREALATRKERSVQDITGKEVLVDLDMNTQNVVVKWSDDDDVSHQVQIPDLALLSPDRAARLSILGNVIDRLGPAAPDFKDFIEDIKSRELSHQELSEIFDETSNGVAALQASLFQKIKHGPGINVVDIIPQSVSYFERFCGPVPGTQEPESYFDEVLVPHRKALLNRNLETGLDICCLGALRDDLTPGQWVASIDDDAIWNALSSSHAESNPFSLLGALDVALYRQGDRRFREFSAEAVAKLLDERLGQQNGTDVYRLLKILADFVLNRINLLQTGPNYPGYWKRMCAWMQAGLIARSFTRSTRPVDVDALQQWTHSNMVAAGDYAGLVDARKEPMLFAERITPQALRNEILGRLHILKSRHENEGCQVPRSRDINHAVARVAGRGQGFNVAYFPGPLEGHRRPTEPVPQEIAQKLEDAWTDSTMAFPLQLLVMASQLFSLGKPELERALQGVKTMAGNNGNAEFHKHLILLELASIIAAANRDTMLADGIADALVRVASTISEREDIQMMLHIMLQAGGAYEVHNAWFKWLEERLARIAIHLPPPPNECLKIFRDHLDGMGTVLLIDSWFHIRAKSIASAGAA